MLGPVDFSDLKDHLRGKVSILCHHNADPDAIGAAYSMERLIHTLDPNAVTEILYPDSASLLAERMISHFKIEASPHPKIMGADVVLVVDTGSLIQLEVLQPMLKTGAARVFIDHHGRDDEIARIANVYIVDESAVATCEIIYQYWRSLGQSPSKDVAEALLLGIAFDSKHFAIGTPRTFRVIAELMELGATLSGARELLQGVMDVSERLARLKAAQRLTIYRMDPWIVVTSNLGSFQSSAARGILNLGADVAIIAGNEKEELKASLRSTEEFYRNSRIHLGEDVTKPLSGPYKGAGGGHPTAAGINGFGEAEKFLVDAVETIRAKLGQPKKDVVSS
jgi:nanoRNase/pAp phosphatase (c-di-AMP/oligoRNAs hydrolase)